MKLQPFEEKNRQIQEAFERLKAEQPERLKRRIDVSFCVQTFGMEPVTESLARLSELGYKYAELPGQYGGVHSGHQQYITDIKKAMEQYDIKCSGVCPFTLAGFSLTEYDYFAKEKAYEYVKHNLEFCKELGGSYYLVTPGPVDRVDPYDFGDYDRSVAALNNLGKEFESRGIACAIEACQEACAAYCHTFEETKQYIADVNHPAIQYIYGDTDHMAMGESHIGQAILDAGKRLKCLHLREPGAGKAIGNAMLDVDTIIRALYLTGFNEEGHFAVGEPGACAYTESGEFSLFAKYPESVKRQMAKETIDYFKEREAEVLGL